MDLSIPVIGEDGKTHLMQHISHDPLMKYPDRFIMEEEKRSNVVFGVTQGTVTESMNFCPNVEPATASSGIGKS